MSGYPLIADHGLIGDLQTSALVATDGTVDWFCAPRFDSPSVFGALLDHNRGGHFRSAPRSDSSPPPDPMWTSTLRARWRTELVTDSLVYRYDPAASPDGLRGSRGHLLALHVRPTSPRWPGPGNSTLPDSPSRRC